MKEAAFRVKAPADDLLMPLLVSNCSPGIVIFLQRMRSELMQNRILSSEGSSMHIVF